MSHNVTDNTDANSPRGVTVTSSPISTTRFYVRPKYDDRTGQPIALQAYHTAKNADHARKIVKDTLKKAREKLEPYKIPKEFFWVRDFPTKIGGKLDTDGILKNALPVFPSNNHNAVMSSLSFETPRSFIALSYTSAPILPLLTSDDSAAKVML